MQQAIGIVDITLSKCKVFFPVGLVSRSRRLFLFGATRLYVSCARVKRVQRYLMSLPAFSNMVDVTCVGSKHCENGESRRNKKQYAGEGRRGRDSR